MGTSLWEVSARFPITQGLREIFAKRASRNKAASAGYVSEKLCDDMIHRLSPYLKRNAPVDILDLWPGCGLWSSKMNDFLRPRRHILVEPNMKLFGSHLKELAKSKPCYKLASGEIYGTNWNAVYEKYLPEQIRPMDVVPGTLPKNDTLLVLASPPVTESKKNHLTPARWWASVMEDCMNQTGLHAYGSVRILAGLSVAELQVVLPRSIHERRRPAMLTESVALHNFEIASGYEIEPWHTLKTWDSIQRNNERVAERSAAQGVITPPGREPLPLQLAPESPVPGKGGPKAKKEVPYHPRARSEGHHRFEKAIRRGENLSKTKSVSAKEEAEIKKEARTARAALNFDNRCSWARAEISKDISAIDERSRDLSRAAADPNATAASLEEIDRDIETRKSAVSQKMADLHFRLTRGWERSLDDMRNEACSNNLDDSVLLWDRRPFEPMLIESDEVFPRFHQTLVYFEADEHAISAQKLSKVPPKDRESMMQLFEAMTLSFSSGNHISIAELADRFFPGQAANDVVKTIPSLAKYVGKRLKPNYGPMPLADDTLDPTECFQENIDYDLSETRVITLPIQVIWDILLEYHKHAQDLSPLQINRLLGGTMTSYRTGEYRLDTAAKKLH
ncbi:uncharacterized protein N7484_007221 [Penicillium longicatenatum]|uniref:uncharacterized protein n=1 Tax=Penicillium longicatenatum TaxID=1561947 RepID=UPI0025497F6C|nr:uncharacterized protein N7484_007221 [Penicillium longicatenatum]KAJ5639359.1 hypothetical protein N7484_007221 [Penicillium longicatenatum]